MFHKIDSCIERKIIYKNDIIFITTLKYKRCLDPKHLNEQDQKDFETLTH
jgi:hypothetical protein